MFKKIYSFPQLGNLMWNLFGGGWVGFLILLVTPWYVSRLGVSGYGVISLWIMMQLLMGLLDAGMGATLIRGFAHEGGERGHREYKQNLLRTLEIFYWLTTVIFGIVFILSAGWIADSWLHIDPQSIDNAKEVIEVMGVSLCIQFPYSLYSSGFSGLQKHRAMNLFQIFGNSLRYGVGALVLLWRADLFCFFVAQSIVALLLVVSIRANLWKALRGKIKSQPRFTLSILRHTGAFSLGMALNSLVAVLLANADRLALSKMVSTYELGLYAIAFTGTGLLQLGIQPFYRVYFPKYSQLVSSADSEGLRREYFRSCQFVASIIIPLSILGGVFAPEIFAVWMGSYTPETILIFRWLLVGVGCSGLGWLPAALQQANGLTKLHVQMMAGALIFGFPLMIFMIDRYGVIGGTTIWVLHGLSDITLGLWLMHKKFFVDDLKDWYGRVIFPPLLITMPILGCLLCFISEEGLRWVNFTFLSFAGILGIVLSLFLSLHYFRVNSIIK